MQGVSTRKVAKITEELCGFEISSTQVSRATLMLDEHEAKRLLDHFSERRFRKNKLPYPGIILRIIRILLVDALIILKGVFEGQYVYEHIVGRGTDSRY